MTHRMKKTWLVALLGLMVLTGSLAPSLGAASPGYGAESAAALSDNELSLGTMLTLALQDEYLARGEYQKIMEKYGPRRPFSNIIKAEERHIAELLPLFDKYGVTRPADRGLELAKVPDTFSACLQAGVEAEIANISMYERFLKRELPADVRAVFEHLLAGSRNHLEAFQRGGGGKGQNR